MAELGDFDVDPSTPDHEAQVARQFAGLAYDLHSDLGGHATTGDMLGYLVQARDIAVTIARDKHRDTSGHPGAGAAAKTASHEPVPLSEQADYRGSAAMASTIGAVGGEPTDAPTGPASGAGTYYTEDEMLTDCPACGTAYAPDLSVCPHCGVANPDLDTATPADEGELRHGELDSPAADADTAPATSEDTASGAPADDAVHAGEPVTLERAGTDTNAGK